MERVNIEVENNPGQLTKTQAAKSTHAKNEYALKAVTILDREKYLTPNSDHYPKYTSARPYRERDDPLSDQYVQPDGDHLAGLKERLLNEHAARNVQEVGRP